MPELGDSLQVTATFFLGLSVQRLTGVLRLDFEPSLHSHSISLAL